MESVSSVFHGRDLFAPAAAALANAAPLGELGPACASESLERLDVGQIEQRGESLCGVIQHVDRFGNLISNLPPPARGEYEIYLGERRVPLHRTYSDVPVGSLLAVVGSHGFLEIACNGGSAAQAAGATRGDVITLRPLPRS